MIILLIFLTILIAVIACFITVYFSSSSDLILPVAVSAVLAGIVQFFIRLWALPTIGFFYPATWYSLILAGVIGFAIGFLFSRGFMGISVPGVICALFLVVLLPSSCQMCHSKRYRALPGTIEKKDFTKHIPQIKLDNIRLVPKSTAATLANKVLGQSRDGTILGSQLEIDYRGGCIQEVKGKLWWIFPLDFTGFFKWHNRKTVPGYIRIDAQNPTHEAELVDTDRVNKKKFDIRYTRKSFFSCWLDRKVYNQFPTIYKDDYTFEVDDNWRPYYVISATSPEVGFNGYKTRGVIIADPQTGEITFKKLGEIPKWVDRVIPLEQALEQMDWWGKYVHGWWNTIFSEKDIQIPTDYWYGKDLFFIKVGKEKFWFTGMSSISAMDQSLVGAMMMNTRTGKTAYYGIHGTDENGVLDTVDASLGADSARWSPTQPIPYNLFGVPTWILPVVSREGIFQKLAMVDMNNINTIAVDKDVHRALEKYRVLLTTHNSSVLINTSGLRRLGPAEVLRVGSSIINGNKTFHLLLSGYENRLFSSSGGTAKTRVISIVEPGDMVKVSFIRTRGPVVPVDSISIEGIRLRR
ncbi:MAG: hypothetical protein GY754_22160 [bacterium]|nr:hypothetical protein [bacterium]